MRRILGVTWVARPGTEPKVASILKEMVELTNQEPGCEMYEASQAVDDPTRFFIYEVYRDDEGLDAHNQSEHFKRLVLGEALPMLLSRERIYYSALKD